jgi:hypothetical protein
MILDIERLRLLPHTIGTLRNDTKVDVSIASEITDVILIKFENSNYVINLYYYIDYNHNKYTNKEWSEFNFHKKLENGIIKELKLDSNINDADCFMILEISKILNNTEDIGYSLKEILLYKQFIEENN